MKQIILIIVAATLLILSFIIILTLRGVKEKTNIPLVSIPTPTPISAPNQSPFLLQHVQFTQFQKTTIAETKEKEVLQLPNIIDHEATDAGQTVYSIQSVNPLIPDEVITKEGIVVFERTSTFTTAPGGLPSLSGFQSQLGKPEEVVDSNSFYGPVASSYLYPKQGITLIANQLTDEVYEVQRYVPMDLQTYKRLYASYIQQSPQDNE